MNLSTGHEFHVLTWMSENPLNQNGERYIKFGSPRLNFPRSSTLNVLTFVMATLTTFFGSGIIYGYNALAPILLHQGAFSSWCKPNVINLFGIDTLTITGSPALCQPTAPIKSFVRSQLFPSIHFCVCFWGSNGQIWSKNYNDPFCKFPVFSWHQTDTQVLTVTASAVTIGFGGSDVIWIIGMVGWGIGGPGILLSTLSLSKLFPTYSGVMTTLVPFFFIEIVSLSSVGHVYLRCILNYSFHLFISY